MMGERGKKAPKRRLHKLWKAVFSSSSSSAVTVVEPFIPGPSSPPAPDHSGVKPNNEKAPKRRFHKLWKDMKAVFSRSSSSAVTVVEPFIPPADPVPGPSSPPAPDHSGVKPNNGQQGLSRYDSLEWFLCPPLPGQVPVEPTETSTGRTAQGAVEASPVSKSSTDHSRSRRAAFCQTAGQEVWRPGSDDRDQDPLPRDGQKKAPKRRFHKLWKAVFSSSSSSAVTVVEPFIPGPSSPPAPDHSGVKPNNGRSGSRRTVSTDSSPGITSSSACSLPEAHVERGSRESLNLCSRGSDSVEGSWSGDGSESPNEKGLSWSDSLERFLCPPLPGQVPVEPTETSTGRTAQGAVEASPVNKSSTESFKSLYNVEKLIGSGGYGRVFLGTRNFDGKKVAIKRIRKINNDRYLNIPGKPEPLVTEVALLLLMKREPISNYVIQLHEWFEHPRSFTLVMEYPEAYGTLYDVITSQAPNEILSWFVMRQAVQAVQHCIHHGVFHSDIHPKNFLIQKDTLRLKLIDFGCGQLVSSEGCESNAYKGIWGYTPPEVFTEPRFHAVPANVWSLGVLLYELSNECLPFVNDREMTEAEVSFINPRVSEPCVDLVTQCLAWNPTERPSFEQMKQHPWSSMDMLERLHEELYG
ncbi:hypothetical protein PO909_033226 [Leuciscus waleckii]